MQLWFCVSTIIESKRFKKALVGKNKQTITTNSVNSLVHWQLTYHDYKLIKYYEQKNTQEKG